MNEQARKLSLAVLDERVSLPAAVDQFERTLIETTLFLCGDNVTRAASRLGVHRNTIHSKLRSYSAARRRG